MLMHKEQTPDISDLLFTIEAFQNTILTSSSSLWRRGKVHSLKHVLSLYVDQLLRMSDIFFSLWIRIKFDCPKYIPLRHSCWKQQQLSMTFNTPAIQISADH